MATWPSDLPQQVDQDGFGSGAPDNVLRSTVDAGPDKTRRRFTSAPYPLRGQMAMTGAQLESFISFLDDSIADGAIRFSFPHYRDPTTLVNVKFVSPPTWTAARGDTYIIRLDLQVLP